MLKILKTKLMQRFLSGILIVLMFISIIPMAVYAEVEPPTSFDAPAHFGVLYGGAYKFNTYISASDSMREFMKLRAEEDPENKQGFTVYYQVDYKINNGNWHYTSDWDSPETAPEGQNHNGELVANFVNDKIYAASGSAYFSQILTSDDEETKKIQDMGWDYFKSNSFTFRARFAHSFDGKTFVLSPWSDEFVLSANVKADTNKMINHAPVLKEARIEMQGDKPYMEIKVEKPSKDVGDLNVMTGGRVAVEIFLKKLGDKDYKLIHYWWLSNESILFDATDYFEDKNDSYEAAAFEIKTRYRLDLREYRQANIDSTVSVDIYSPFSNTISQNMPAWSEASEWATGELKKADEMGLIPDMLKGVDMRKPITRREFAAVSVKLYEKLSGNTAIPVATNPFKDTNDIEVLKAYNVGVTDGVSSDKFDPDKILNREQAATMLTRVFKKTFVKDWSLKEDNKFTFNYTMPPKFTDDAKISDWAKPSVYFMATHEIIKGIDNKNNFGPRAITSTEQANSYASATREQSLIISMRMAENLNETDSKEIVPANTSSSSIVGSWMYTSVSGNVGLTVLYEFNEDRTFSKALGTVVNYLHSSTLFEGKYKISENKLVLYEQKKSEVNSLSWEELWKSADPIIINIPVEDEELTFEKTSEGNLVITKKLADYTDVTQYTPFK